MSLKGKIDAGGCLLIQRGGEFKLQQCPHTPCDFQVNNDIMIRQPCGDWCPKFGEPYKVQDVCTYQMHLVLCEDNDIPFDELIDERR